MNSATVTLPWPPSILSPNARVHWAERAKVAARARRDACILCQSAGLRALPWPGMSVTLTFCPPDRRRRDTDNMLSSLKPALDGIADATGIDDSLWHLTLHRGAPRKGGAVVVEATRMSGGWRSIGEVAAEIVERAAR